MSQEKIIQIAVESSSDPDQSGALYALTSAGRVLVRINLLHGRSGWYEEKLPDFTAKPDSRGYIPFADEVDNPGARF